MDSPATLGATEAARLKSVYYDIKNSASFSTPEKLYVAVEKSIPLKQIKDWLSSQITYTLHRSARVNFSRNRYIVYNIGDQWQADLADFSSLSAENDDTRYVLLTIDSFSRFVCLRPLKSKTATEVLENFKDILQGSKYPCRQLLTDRGKEFLNKQFSSFLKSQDITHILPSSDTFKAALAERAIRTIKGILYKVLTANYTFRYLDVLQDVADSYNKRVHSSINIAPRDVNHDNVFKIWRFMNRKRLAEKVQKPSTAIKVGDYVRVSKNKNMHMEKGFLPNFSDIIYTVTAHIHRQPDVYRLSDEDGPIDGVWYRHELQKVVKSPDTLYRIEKIIKTQKKKGIKMCLVKWMGQHKSKNSWVPESEIVENYG
jgi:Integrase core domain/Chromo (CHRromatin Organisation MOdifier) domain